MAESINPEMCDLKYKTWLNLDESAKVILGLDTSKN